MKHLWLTLLLAFNVSALEFTDGRQEYRGKRYLFLGDSALQITIPVAPKSDHVLEFLWGAKNDQRAATLTINRSICLPKNWR